MNIIVCLDEKNGMLFNHRRQSQDLAVRERITEMAGARLRMNEYSAGQFENAPAVGYVGEDFLSGADAEDYCFVEDPALIENAENIDGVICFKWNRAYPADRRLPFDPAEGRHLVISEDFAGNSHEKITLEVYRK